MTIEQLGIIVGISATVSAGTVYILKAIRTRVHRSWRKFQGKWTNKSYFDVVLGERIVDMTFRVDFEEGRIYGKGLLINEKTRESFYFKCGGRLYYRSSTVKVVLYTDNFIGIIGKVKLQRKGISIIWRTVEKNVTWPHSPIPPISEILPKRVYLFPPSNELEEMKALKSKGQTK